MKNILVITILWSLQFKALAATVELDIQFTNKGKTHIYTAAPEAKKPNTYVLNFIDETKKKKTRTINSQQLKNLKLVVTDIIWENQFKKPVPAHQCKIYAKIATATEKTTVCQQNAKATGRTYGLLNQLRDLF